MALFVTSRLGRIEMSKRLFVCIDGKFVWMFDVERDNASFKDLITNHPYRVMTTFCSTIHKGADRCWKRRGLG